MNPTRSDWLEFLIHDAAAGAFWIYIIMATVTGTGKILDELIQQTHWPPDRVILGAIALGLLVVWRATASRRRD